MRTSRDFRKTSLGAVSSSALIFAMVILLSGGCAVNKLIDRKGGEVFVGRVKALEIEKIFHSGYFQVQDLHGSLVKRFEADALTQYVREETPRVGDIVKVHYVVENGKNKIASIEVTKEPAAGGPPVSVKSETVCNDEPQERLSGRGQVTLHSVNMRSGAGTQCSKTGIVKKADRFNILGKRGNWFYIQLDYGPKGWVYGKLVKQLDQTGTAAGPEATSTAAEATQSAEKAQPVAEAPGTTKALPHKRKKNVAIAVIQFANTTPEAKKINLGKMVSEKITTALVNSSAFQPIERSQLKKIVGELELEGTGVIDTSQALQIGKLSHADAIIVGSAALYGNQVSVDARIIEVESGIIISAESRTDSYSLSRITKMARTIVHSLARKFYREQ